MVQSPSWEANWFAASQEIPRISRIPKVHYRTHKRTPPVSILGQPNPVHIPTSHLLEIHPNIIQSPSWETNWFAASQEIHRILWNPKVHYRTHKRPPPVSILGQPNPVHIPTSNLLEIHPNIRPSTPRSPQRSSSLRFPHQDPIHSLSSPIRATCPAHLILLDFITRTTLGELLVMQSPPFRRYLVPPTVRLYKQYFPHYLIYGKIFGRSI